MQLKLQARYALATVGLLVFMLIAYSSVVSIVIDEQYTALREELSADLSRNLESNLQQRANDISGYLSNKLFDPIYFYNPEEVYLILQAALSLNEVAGAHVVDKKGHIFHDGTEELQNFDNQRYHDKKGLVTVLERQESYFRILEDRLLIGKPIHSGNQLVGGLFVEFWRKDIQNNIQQTTDIVNKAYDGHQKRTYSRIMLITLLLISIGILCTMLIARSMVQPIRHLIRYTERLGKGDFNFHYSIDRQDEIGELANSFNEMGRKLQKRTEEISHQANHDALTGLPNRTKFIECLDVLINNEITGSFAVLFIDLDEFKGINDNYGHEAGDELLRDLAERIKEKLRSSDLILPSSEGGEAFDSQVVARFGGDEFLICLPKISKQNDAVIVVERLFEALREPITIRNDQISISGSIGIACYPQAGNNAEELIKSADIAMYHAKSNGKNTYSLFTPQMNEHLERRMDTEREIRKALQSPEQFELWYQPQVDLHTQALVGAEALVRWRHPVRGLIPPNDFIPVAEESGLIIPLGEQLIKQLCRQLSQWKIADDSPFHVALNLSAKQIYRQDLYTLFSKYLEQYQVPTHRLRVEITESHLMLDENAAEKTLSDLRRLGIEVWLDDFGTGFSSLSYLRRFQVDGIKIDRSFIADLEDDPQDRALTAAIVSMAQSLKLPVIAEGIEEAVQRELLIQQQCSLGQGFLFSKPLYADEFKSCFLDVEEKKACN